MTIKVDLLPAEKKGFQLDPVALALLVVVLLVGLGCYSWGGILDRQIQDKQKEKLAVESEIAAKRAKLPGLDSMAKENKKIELQIQTIRGLKNDPVRYGNLLWELAELLPSNVYVTSVNVDPSQQSVTLAGTSVAYGSMLPLESIAKLMRGFQTARYFTDATLSSTAQTNSDAGVGYTFQIEAKYNAEDALKAPDQIQPKSARNAASPAPAGAGQPPAAAPAQPSPAGGAPPAASPDAAPSASPAATGSPAPSPSTEAGKTGYISLPQGKMVGGV